jgi:hypothetical protein
MSFPRAHQIFAAELENYLSGVHGADDVCVDICNCIAGDFKSERPVLRMSIVLAEFLQVISYLTVNVRQTHFCSYTGFTPGIGK